MTTDLLPVHPGAVKMACKVKKFDLKFGDWDLSWPSFWSDTTTIRLPVSFKLELEDGSPKSDCYITQYKKGRVEMNGKSTDSFTEWTVDASTSYWWNGTDWNGGDGDWSWFGNDVAKFKDKPGFNSIERSAFPVYWGGVARAGYFEFKTVVLAAADGVNPVTEVASLYWGILINVRSPDRGGFMLNACTENGEIASFRK
jgi:hypothetical protein